MEKDDWSDDDVLSAEEVFARLTEIGIPVEKFIEAVKTGAVQPFHLDGSPASFDEMPDVIYDLQGLSARRNN